MKVWFAFVNGITVSGSKRCLARIEVLIAVPSLKSSPCVKVSVFGDNEVNISIQKVCILSFYIMISNSVIILCSSEK